jgi:predicted CopG family antitoxin
MPRWEHLHAEREFQDALKQYAKRKDKNLRLLMQYAQAFQVERILDRYLEVLLQ